MFQHRLNVSVLKGIMGNVGNSSRVRGLANDISYYLNHGWNVATGPSSQSDARIHSDRQTGSQGGRRAQEEEVEPPAATAGRGGQRSHEGV